jgi:cytochrome P450
VTNEVIDELDAVLGGTPPTMDQLKKLPLLEACVKESMRILPPVPFTIRVAMRRAIVGGVQVKSGDRVVCSHYMTHHLPELYPDPERFDPSRWFTIRPDSYEYMPFSAGPRMCLGYTFAMTAIMISLAMILQRFRFTVARGSRIDRRVRVTMGSRHGLPLLLHAADRGFQRSEVRGNIHEMVRLTD